MKAERWERLQELFHVAVDLEEDERRQFLDGACADDPMLRRQVESLVGARTETDPESEEPIADILQGAASELAAGDLRSGQRIGPYRLLEELGHGGMGTVFLAERADQEFEQRVAVKVMRIGLRNPHLRGRFLTERQILARLEHPNIARLLDGGTTEEGSPYVVMEYVEGQPIERFCEAHSLSVKERLALFRRVCSAVETAHRNLVVHRDLKPSNILVTADGTPKLLDFGIAKLLDPSRAVQTLALTQTSQRLMTPRYASPEQVRGEAVTTSSDVYSLGLVLYELLVGRPAHRFLGTSAAEMERVVCEQMPPRPSAAVGGPRADDETVALPDAEAEAGPPPPRSRGETARRSRELAGDLDRIVLMALRKEPERRYGSVADLSEDLRLYLEGRPVRAQEDTWRYRTAKFVQRHRLGVLAGAAILALLTLGGVLLSVQSVRLARERDRALVAERQARTEAATASQVSSFLVDLFQVADPNQARGREITALEMLDRGSARLDEELTEQPLVRARLLGTVGGVYQGLGLLDQAVSRLEEALRLQREILGEHADVAATLHTLAQAWNDRGDFGRGEELLRDALDMRRRLDEPEGPADAALMDDLAFSLWGQGRGEEAEELLRASLVIRRRDLGARDPSVASALTGLAGVLRLRSGYGEAVPLLEEALDINRGQLGDDHPDTVANRNNLAATLSNMGHYDRAAELYEETLVANRSLYPGDHKRIGDNLNNLAYLEEKRGNLDKALTYAEEAVAMFRRLQPGGHPAIGFALNNLGQVLRNLGEHDRAEAALREALEARRRLLGEEHPYVAFTLDHLAVQLTASGKLDEASATFEEALEMRRRILPPDHPDIATTLTGLGELRRRQGRLEEAESLLLEARELQERVLAEDHIQHAGTLLALGRVLLEKGDAESAERRLRQAYELRARVLPPGNWKTAEVATTLAESLDALGRTEEAREMAEWSLGHLNSSLGAEHRLTRRAAQTVGQL